LDPPPQTGGVIANGRYTVTSVTFYAESALSVPGEVIDFRDGSYRRNVTFYNPVTDLITGGFTEVGTYESPLTGLLRIEGTTCSLGNAPRSEFWEFSAVGSQLLISNGLPGYRLYQRTEIPD
jgi:hypothetical protein